VFFFYPAAILQQPACVSPWQKQKSITIQIQQQQQQKHEIYVYGKEECFLSSAEAFEWPAAQTFIYCAIEARFLKKREREKKKAVHVPRVPQLQNTDNKKKKKSEVKWPLWHAATYMILRKNMPLYVPRRGVNTRHSSRFISSVKAERRTDDGC
jgi:hypothetical protein